MKISQKHYAYTEKLQNIVLKNQNKLKYTPCSYISEDLTLLRGWQHSPNWSSVQNSTWIFFFFFCRNPKIFDNFDKQILKFIKKCNGLRRVKIIFKNNKVDGFTFPNFKTYHKAKATQTVRWCGTGIKIDEWNTRIQI